jgi:hypothetical protein
VVRPPDAEPLRAEVEAFLAAAAGESAHLRNDGVVGARAVELLELAALSNDQQRVVTEIPPSPGRWRANGHDASRAEAPASDASGRDRDRRRQSEEAE